MKRWSILLVVALLAACSDTDKNEAQQTTPTETMNKALENNTNVDSEINVEQDDSDILASGYTVEEEVQMAIDHMYEWHSYHANYRFAYETEDEDIEYYNLIETEYVASSPIQKHSIISTPYFEEEYYAIEDVGVFSYADYEELWDYDENTDLVLEDDLIYSMNLMNRIVEVADEITITQDIDSPNFANIIFKEEVNLFDEFRFYLSARTETVQDIMYANVIEVPDGEAYIYYLDNNIVYYKLLLYVIFEDFSTGVLVIEEEFDRINEIEEIVIPDAVYAG